MAYVVPVAGGVIVPGVLREFVARFAGLYGAGGCLWCWMSCR